MDSYTERMENLLWDSLCLDDGDDDYSKVLDILNADFRTFGDALLDIMQRKAGVSISRPVEHIKSACAEAGIDISAIGSPNQLKDWFRGSPRPKKSADSRRKMFALSFALKLTPDETSDLFHKAYLDRAFNQRDYRELIYYYCLSRNLSFVYAERLIAEVNLDAAESNDRTLYTSVVASEVAKLQDDRELLEYIHSHGHNFSVNNKKAKEILLEQKEKARRYVEDYADREKSLDKAAIAGKSIGSDNFMYYAITDQEISVTGGSKPISFKNTYLPKEIKTNFAKFSVKEDSSYEELRKAIILLFSYSFWSEAEKQKMTDIIDDYIAQLDALLNDANMPPLYYGNPYDWLFLYCTVVSEHPLDTFQGILAEVLGSEE